MTLFSRTPLSNLEQQLSAAPSPVMLLVILIRTRVRVYLRALWFTAARGRLSPGYYLVRGDGNLISLALHSLGKQGW